VSGYAATPLIVTLSPGHSDINQVSSMVTNRARQEIIWMAPKNSKFTQTTGTVDVFDPRTGISGPTSRRASACPNLHE